MAATLYGHTVDSELPLPRAREGAGPRGRLTVVRADAPPARSGVPDVAIEERFTVHRQGERLVVWCERSGTFAIDPASGRVESEVGPGGAVEWEHRLACVAVPLLLAERGDLALHAAAVVTPAGAVVLCGESGRGKSTTAWALARRGFGVLAEDGCVIELPRDRPPLVWPGLAGVRLRDPAGGRPLSADGGASPEPVPLAAVVVLGPRGGSKPAVEPVAAVESITTLMPHGVHALGPSQAAVFRGAAAVARAAPVFRGTLPDDLAGAGAHAEALLEAATSRAGVAGATP